MAFSVILVGFVEKDQRNSLFTWWQKFPCAAASLLSTQNLLRFCIFCPCSPFFSISFHVSNPLFPSSILNLMWIIAGNTAVMKRWLGGKDHVFLLFFFFCFFSYSYSDS